ncbi:MAG TPA: RES family NAD+ phosphorylase [Solirubrobacteraceae bacterium]|nr:RES family NAD+ phosphorylase [Solirubrobacteraceae bacterium]
MAPEPETISVTATAYRYSSYDTPFWVRENSRPGRWHRQGDGATQYLAMSTDGAWAELIRYEELTVEDEVAMVSVSMWAVAIEQGMIADYSIFEQAERAGFDPAALVDEDHERCQREAARLRELNYAGVLAPSAALPGAVNLTLFGPRMASTWERPKLLASSVPATILTKGAPPPGLLERVRHIGAIHVGLAAHEANRSMKQASRGQGQGEARGR